MKQKDFTLLELLVVVSVISVLMSLFLPALAKAIGNSRQSSCKNNLKQIGMAAYIYIQDYNEFTMPGKFANTGNYNHWANYVFEQFPNKKLFICPSAGEEDYFNPSGGSGDIKEASYIMNLMPDESSAWSGFAIDHENQRGWGTLDDPLHDGKVVSPLNSLYIMDVAQGGIHYNHSGVNKYGRTDHGLISVPPTGNVRWVGYHHFGEFNALFGDQHVELLYESTVEQWIVNGN